MSLDLPTLLERATSGRQLDKSRLFRPSWCYSMIDDPFWVWCEYHAPAEERLDETTLFDQYLMQQGNVWEDQYVRATFPDAYVVRASWGEAALRETLEAMLRGEAAIHGGALWLLGKDVYGFFSLGLALVDHPLTTSVVPSYISAVFSIIAANPDTFRSTCCSANLAVI